VKRHYLKDNPAVGIEAMNEGQDMRSPPRALTIKEWESLVIRLKNETRLLRYYLGARAGLRPREIGRLRWHHMDLEGGWLRLDAAVTKSKRADDLPMRDEIKKLAVSLKPADAKPSDKVFIKSMSPRTWLRDLERAGIITIEGDLYCKEKGSSYTLHGYRDDRGRVLSMRCLRKTFGTHMAMVEPNISTVAKLMRHTNPKMTLELYEDARIMDLRGSVEKLGDSLVPVKGQKPSTSINTIQQHKDKKNRATA
jgi:integrase